MSEEQNEEIWQYTATGGLAGMTRVPDPFVGKPGEFTDQLEARGYTRRHVFGSDEDWEYLEMWEAPRGTDAEYIAIPTFKDEGWLIHIPSYPDMLAFLRDMAPVVQMMIASARWDLDRDAAFDRSEKHKRQKR